MKLLITLFACFFATASLASDWDSDPANWSNSDLNWENSSLNWDNSPLNWDNSAANWGNDRIIRSNAGIPSGYAVPRLDGGVNFYNSDGYRWGYLPATGD